MSSSPLHPQPFAVVVTADDFGIGEATSRGIIDSHLRGPVTSTSLMVVTGDHVLRSIPLLEKAPNLEVGLHLVLTRCGEKPVVATRASGLVDRDGQFFTHEQLWKRTCMSRRFFNQTAIAEEIAAQALMFQRLMGRRPAYVDSHHHAHQVPVIRRALVQVMDGGLLPAISRVTREPREFRRIESMRWKRAVARGLGIMTARRFAGDGVWTNDSFFGMIGPTDLEGPFPWGQYLKAMPNCGVIEWIVHPGEADDTLEGRDGYRAGRVAEWKALTEASVAGDWEPLRPYLARKSELAKNARRGLAGG